MAKEKLMNPKDWLLEIAQEVETHQDHWTQLASSRDIDGNDFAPDNKAMCWCAVGFLTRDAQKLSTSSTWQANDALQHAGGSRFLFIINDGLKSPADFVSWFRSAAALID